MPIARGRRVPKSPSDPANSIRLNRKAVGMFCSLCVDVTVVYMDQKKIFILNIPYSLQEKKERSLASSPSYQKGGHPEVAMSSNCIYDK
jgi:hypothetical protein